MRRLEDRIVVVTGAAQGMGRAIAIEAAREGAAWVTLADIQDEAGQLAAAEVRDAGAKAMFVRTDLRKAADIEHMIAETVRQAGGLDVLVNNAGVIMTRRVLTADGLETTFATNHLGPFLLTNLLRGRLERSAPARVVTVSSGAHKQVRTIPWDDLARGAPDGQAQSYPLSKLLNILFTVELARRLRDTGVTANCLHPGFVRSALGRDVTGVLGAVVRLVLPFQPGPATGADTSVYLAGSPEVAEVTGGYFVKRKPARPSALATDDRAAARLWTLSEELAGLDPGR
jgi:NAD(P)-dependent dehydrogenase (short-subunit alcohol dehydrogenase family)